MPPFEGGNFGGELTVETDLVERPYLLYMSTRVMGVDVGSTLCGESAYFCE